MKKGKSPKEKRVKIEGAKVVKNEHQEYKETDTKTRLMKR